MFKLDEAFWKSIRAENYSARQKQQFEKEVLQELEIRVGKRISKGLTEDQLDEFEFIIDNDVAFNTDWLKRNHPGYTDCKQYQLLKNKGYKGGELINELTNVLWLQSNKPDFAKIVDDCREEVCKEIEAFFNDQTTQKMPVKTD